MKRFARAVGAAPVAIAGLVVGGCGHSGPREVLRDYRQAVARGEVRRVRELSDAHFREAHDVPALEKQLRKNPRLFSEAAERLDGATRLEVVALTENGERIRLVEEDGRWRVAEGGLLMPSLETPEAAARTFFFAATGHLGLLRRCLTDEAAARFPSDYLLGKHLHDQRDRIFAARDELGPIVDGMATVDGDRASIAYGDGKAMELVLEEGRWRVVDVE